MGVGRESSGERVDREVKVRRVKVNTHIKVPTSTHRQVLSVWVKVDTALTLLEPESRFVLSPWDDLEPY